MLNSKMIYMIASLGVRLLPLFRGHSHTHPLVAQNLTRLLTKLYLPEAHVQTSHRNSPTPAINLFVLLIEPQLPYISTRGTVCI